LKFEEGRRGRGGGGGDDIKRRKEDGITGFENILFLKSFFVQLIHLFLYI